MIRVSIFLFITLFCTTLSNATSFEEANAYFSAGKYQQARDAYIQVIDDKGYSASLCYNLANSYAQLGQNGMAILYYERALRLSPKNADIHQNLKQIQEEAHVFKQGAINRLFAAHNLNLWTLLTLFFFFTIVLLLALAKHPLLSGRYRLPFSLTAAGICCAMSIVSCFFTYQHWPASIITQQTELLLSPFEGAQNKGQIVEGQTVFIKASYGNFRQIKDINGRGGWVKFTDIKDI